VTRQVTIAWGDPTQATTKREAIDGMIRKPRIDRVFPSLDRYSETAHVLNPLFSSSYVGDGQRLSGRVRVPPVPDQSHRQHDEALRDIPLPLYQDAEQGLAPLLFPLDHHLRLRGGATWGWYNERGVTRTAQHSTRITPMAWHSTRPNRWHLRLHNSKKRGKHQHRLV